MTLLMSTPPAVSSASSSGPSIPPLQFLMTRVDAFVGVTRQSDDITCMIFRAKH